MKNVFHFTCRPRYYLTHPIKLIKEFFGCIGDMWRRATRGWTYSDVWNFNDWFLETIPDMLDYLADNGYSYPGNKEFDSIEAWHEWLHTQAAAIRSAQEEEQIKRNEHWPAYEAALDQTEIDVHPDPDKPDYWEIELVNEPEDMDEIREKYFARLKEIEDESQENLAKAMSELARLMPTLWD